MIIMEPFSDKIEGVVNDEVTIRATVEVATYELYLNWLYNTLTCFSVFDDAYRVWTMCYLPSIFTSSDLQFIINVQ